MPASQSRVDSMSRVVGLVQSKGGVGKTTTALNLAAELARRGSNVSVIDADPSGHATAIAEDGRLPFRVKAHLLEEVTDKAVADWRARSGVVRPSTSSSTHPGRW